MRLFWTTIVLAAIVPATASAQQPAPGPSGMFPPGTFLTEPTAGKARPENIEEDLVGTPRDIRTTPRAPTLPDLTHRASELSGEGTIASVKPHGSAEQARLTSHIFTFDFEAPLGRGVYAGADWALAAARGPEESGTQFVAGQPMLFGRAVRSFSRERYSVGAGLGVLPPVFTYGGETEGARLEAGTPSTLVSVVRPWDFSTFLDRRLTAKPWVDLRVQWRRAVVQVRQALDVSFRTGAPTCSTGASCDNAGDMQLVSISTLYVGWQPQRELAVGVEAWQVYLLKTQLPIADRDRSAFAVSPSVRFFYRWVEPAISMLFPIGSPLLNAADSYFGVRIDLRVWFGGR
jgi:hypothetical protein